MLHSLIIVRSTTCLSHLNFPQSSHFFLLISDALAILWLIVGSVVAPLSDEQDAVSFPDHLSPKCSHSVCQTTYFANLTKPENK